MAEDWEKLGEEWKDHPVGLIAEVDCTSDEGQPVCEDFEVQVRLLSSIVLESTFGVAWSNIMYENGH